jgi:hypothetical protein
VEVEDVEDGKAEETQYFTASQETVSSPDPPVEVELQVEPPPKRKRPDETEAVVPARAFCFQPSTSAGSGGLGGGGGVLPFDMNTWLGRSQKTQLREDTGKQQQSIQRQQGLKEKKRALEAGFSTDGRLCRVCSSLYGTSKVYAEMIDSNKTKGQTWVKLAATTDQKRLVDAQTRHLDSAGHNYAVRELAGEQSKQEPFREEAPAEPDVKMTGRWRGHVRNLMLTVQHMCRHMRPFDMFPQLAELSLAQGSLVGMNWTNRRVLEEMTQVLYDQLRKGVLSLLLEAEFVVLSMDDSTKVAIRRSFQLLLFISLPITLTQFLRFCPLFFVLGLCEMTTLFFFRILVKENLCIRTLNE